MTDSNAHATTATIVPIRDGKALLEHFTKELSKHDIALSEQPNGLLMELPTYGLSAVFKPERSGLNVVLKAPNANYLFFLKEEIVTHTAEIDAEVAEAIRWSDGDAHLARPPNFHVLTVKKSQRILQGLQRVTFQCDDARVLDADGIHLRMMLPRDLTRRPVWPTVGDNGVTRWPKDHDALHARAVTISDLRTATDELDIDLVVHEGGLISDWAQAASEGYELGVMGPGGDKNPPVSQNLLLAGDETALPAIRRLLGFLDSKATGSVLVAARDSEEVCQYFPQTSLKVTILSPTIFAEEITARIEAHHAANPVDFAWFGGEYSHATHLRHLFKSTFGLPSDKMSSAAYWRIGRAGYQ